MNSTIYSVFAREILDSRGNPTVETTVILQSGYRGVAGVPAGASRGKYEASELRDEDRERYNGMGVLKAVNNVNTVIAPALVGKDVLNQRGIDSVLLALDGTPNKEKLGANSILSVSVACAIAAAQVTQMPLYRYINALINTALKVPLVRMSTPTFNLINGGLHGAGNLDFQEFHLIPASNKPFSLALEMGTELYYAIKRILEYRNAVHSVGDEGGFAPNLFTNAEALEILIDAIKTTHYRFTIDVFLGLDVAASHFKSNKGYLIKDKPQPLGTREFIAFLKEIHEKYRLLYLEDPLEEDDWKGWKEITQLMGAEVNIVGDDLLVTNPDRLKKAIVEQACNSILLKPNQIGTLTEFLSVVVEAKTHGIKCITSHRSGETNDSYIADFAVGIQSEYVKFGAPARGERIVKYNRLLAIEQELFGKK